MPGSAFGLAWCRGSSARPPEATATAVMTASTPVVTARVMASLRDAIGKTPTAPGNFGIRLALHPADSHSD